MADYPRCPQCGARMPSGAGGRFCPKCLFKGAVIHEPDCPTAHGSRSFGKFELHELLGIGGMGAVYSAFDTVLKREVALKLIRWSGNHSPIADHRFRIEAEAVARLDHPNIVPVYEVNEVEGEPYIAMKLIRGRTLRAIMLGEEAGQEHQERAVHSNLPLEKQQDAARLVACLARAVHHAHERRVIHRDLKPANILIDETGRPYLTDFGLAKLLDAEANAASRGTAWVGTLDYMAPEQTRVGPVTPAVDIHGLGVLLYELLTGRIPFQRSTTKDTLQAIESSPPTRPLSLVRTVRRDLETICLRCLEKSPDRRYISALALAEDLEAWLENRPIKARPAGLGYRAIQWSRRNRMAAGLIGSLSAALVLAVLLVLAVVSGRDKSERAKEIAAEAAETMRNILLSRISSSILGKEAVTVGSEELQRFCGRVLEQDPRALHYSLGINLHADPTYQIQAYAGPLVRISESMSAQLGRPVRIDLRVYSMDQGSFDEIASGRVDFQRLGIVSYLRARAKTPMVQAIAQETRGKDMVIYALADSGITNLAGFMGRRFAFGDTNSTMSALAKFLFMKAGVSPATLAAFTNHVSTARASRKPPVPDEDAADDVAPAPEYENQSTCGQTCEMVKAGLFDGSLLRRNYFVEQFTRPPELLEIAHDRIPPNLYAARAKLETNVVAAFSNAMLALKGEILKDLSHCVDRSGFKPVNQTNIADYQRILTRDAAGFDNPPQR